MIRRRHISDVQSQHEGHVQIKDGLDNQIDLANRNIQTLQQKYKGYATGETFNWLDHVSCVNTADKIAQELQQAMENKAALEAMRKANNEGAIKNLNRTQTVELQVNTQGGETGFVKAFGSAMGEVFGFGRRK